jgi:hypothetical protein
MLRTWETNLETFVENEIGNHQQAGQYLVRASRIAASSQSINSWRFCFLELLRLPWLPAPEDHRIAILDA